MENKDVIRVEGNDDFGYIEMNTPLGLSRTALSKEEKGTRFFEKVNLGLGNTLCLMGKEGKVRGVYHNQLRVDSDILAFSDISSALKNLTGVKFDSSADAFHDYKNGAVIPFEKGQFIYKPKTNIYRYVERFTDEFKDGDIESFIGGAFGFLLSFPIYANLTGGDRPDAEFLPFLIGGTILGGVIPKIPKLVYERAMIQRMKHNDKRQDSQLEEFAKNVARLNDGRLKENLLKVEEYNQVRSYADFILTELSDCFERTKDSRGISIEYNGKREDQYKFFSELIQIVNEKPSMETGKEYSQIGEPISEEVLKQRAVERVAVLDK